MLPGLLTSGGRLGRAARPGRARAGGGYRWRRADSTMVTILKSAPRTTTINASRECPRCRPGRNCPWPRVGHGKGQGAVADLGHLGVLAQQDPGEAALAFDLLEHLRPQPADVGHGELRGAQVKSSRPVSPSKAAAPPRSLPSCRASGSRRGCGCRRSAAVLVEAPPRQARGSNTEGSTPRELRLSTPLIARVALEAPFARVQARSSWARRGPGTGLPHGRPVGSPTTPSRRSSRSSRAWIPRSSTSAPGSRTRAHISSRCRRGAVVPRISVSPDAITSAARVNSPAPSAAACDASRSAWSGSHLHQAGGQRIGHGGDQDQIPKSAQAGPPRTGVDPGPPRSPCRRR